MINPETDLVCLARRALDLAARVGTSALPAEIRAEAIGLRDELASDQVCAIRSYALVVCAWLISFAEVDRSDARMLCAESLQAMADRLRELLSEQERAAA